MPLPQLYTFCAHAGEHAATATVLTRAPHPLVLADAAATTRIKHAPQAPVLADLASDIFLTHAPHTLVLTDARSAAFSAIAPPMCALAWRHAIFNSVQRRCC